VRTAPVQTPFFAPCRHGKPAWQRRRLLPMPGARLTSHTTGWQAQRILVAPKRPRRRYADVKSYRIAILLRGDREGRRAATPHNNRFYRVFEELAALGIDVEPAVYDEAIADEVRRQRLAVDGVLVWVDPIHGGKSRTELDVLLCDVAMRGSWVSAHPDVIPQDRRQGSLAPQQTSRMGTRYPSLLHGGRIHRCLPGAAPIRPARPQAQPRQWRPRG